MYIYKGFTIIIGRSTMGVDVYGKLGFIGSFASEQDAEEYINSL